MAVTLPTLILDVERQWWRLGDGEEDLTKAGELCVALPTISHYDSESAGKAVCENDLDSETEDIGRECIVVAFLLSAALHEEMLCCVPQDVYRSGELD